MPHPGLEHLHPSGSGTAGGRRELAGTSLFDHLPAHRGHETQQAAAADFRRKAPTARQKVYEFIEARGTYGATIEQISLGLPMHLPTVCARVNELHKKYGLICDSGRRCKNVSGSDAIIWIGCP